MDFFFSKPELKLAVLDQVMLKQKRFQTRKDWEIEKETQDVIWRNYYIAMGTFAACFALTAPTTSVKRWTGPPDSVLFPAWRAGKDALRSVILGLDGVRPQATGFYRQALCMMPTLLVLSTLQHIQECHRWESYLNLSDKTAFGKIAKTLEDGTFGTSTVDATLDSHTAAVLHTKGDSMRLTMA
eukprot:TRINITY_DN449_c3_g1_i1.p1 TRINITY_DN449_c3_g1~~TRINITY_DN449_c3_g1_i1.p1  ORF type:complete len:184 (+),score=36.30 TRINITY_DN449_c3_g1_i1:105-656(+)